MFLLDLFSCVNLLACRMRRVGMSEADLAELIYAPHPLCVLWVAGYCDKPESFPGFHWVVRDGMCVDLLISDRWTPVPGEVC